MLIQSTLGMHGLSVHPSEHQSGLPADAAPALAIAGLLRAVRQLLEAFDSPLNLVKSETEQSALAIVDRLLALDTTARALLRGVDASHEDERDLYALLREDMPDSGSVMRYLEDQAAAREHANSTRDRLVEELTALDKEAAALLIRKPRRLIRKPRRSLRGPTQRRCASVSPRS